VEQKKPHKPSRLSKPKIHYIPIEKLLYETIGRLDITAYNKKHQPLIMARIQRKKPSWVESKTIPTKKNPNKISILKIGKPTELEIWTYKNQPEYFFISSFGDWINIRTEHIKPIIKALKKLLLI